ncbi:hypothetical protein KC327_g15 [Hortaea werneckii]|nr:hypothetical protein KC327_g15 [Hortaea werneckii]
MVGLFIFVRCVSIRRRGGGRWRWVFAVMGLTSYEMTSSCSRLMRRSGHSSKCHWDLVRSRQVHHGYCYQKISHDLRGCLAVSPHFSEAVVHVGASLDRVHQGSRVEIRADFEAVLQGLAAVLARVKPAAQTAIDPAVVAEFLGHCLGQSAAAGIV